MIKKLLGTKKSETEREATSKKKKKNGYFLELEEDNNGNYVVAAAKQALEKVPVQEATQAAEQAIENVVKTVSKSTPSLNGITADKAQTNGKKPAKSKATQASNNGKVESEPAITFAPDNLMPIPTNSRRFPGPSMNGFKDMARQVQNPNFRG